MVLLKRLALVLAGFAGVFFLAANLAAEEAPQADTGAGLNIEFFARPHAGGEDPGGEIEVGKTAEVGFRITDSASGYPVADLHPAAWVVRRDSLRKKPDQDSCDRGIKKYAAGGLIKETSGDLNNYFIISLNADQTVGIFNPLVNLATSNLMALIPLKGQAAGWAFDDSLGLLYVSLSDKNEVAVVDIHRQAVVKSLAVGKNPSKILSQPDGRYLWVASGGGVSVIDPVRREVVKTLSVGAGEIDFAFDAKGGITYIGTAGDGRVLRVDQATLEAGESLALDAGPMHLAYSQLGDALYVASGTSGVVNVLFSGRGERMETLRLAPGISRMKASPDGRFVFALNREASTLTLIDASTTGVSRKLNTLKQPDDVGFSKNFAYLHHAGSNHMSIIQLSALTLNSPPPVADIPMGAKAPGEGPGLKGVSLMDVIPDEGGMLIANPADLSIYLYREGGMLAPSNSFKTYTAAPLGLFIYDHSLVERHKPGEYASTVTPEQGGAYDVFFLLSNPTVSLCFEMEVKGTPFEQKFMEEKFVLENLTENGGLVPGAPSRLRFRLTRGEPPKPIGPLKDLRVLTVYFFGGWQTRAWAKPVGDGIFEVEVKFPRPGKYHLMVQSGSLGVRFGSLQHTYEVGAASADEVSGKRAAP